jgi:hypothetical protein
VNVLGSITRAAEAAKSAFGARTAQAHMVWGDALAKNTDPQTGAVDYPGALRTLSLNPAGAPGMPEATEAASGRMNEQVNRGHAINGWLQGAAGALPDTATRQQIIDMFNRGAATGLLPSDIVSKSIAEVPTDPTKIPAYIQQLRTSALAAGDQFKVHYGVPGTVNTGPAVVPTMTSPVTGAVTVAPGSIPLGMTPEQWNAPIPDYKDPKTGQPALKTVGQALTEAGFKNPGAPAPAGAAAPPVPAPAPAPPGAPAPGATAAPAPVPLGPRPDDKARWDASSALYARDLEGSTTYQQRIFPLAQVASILASGDVTTGQGADALNRAKSFLQTAATSMGWDAQTIQQAKYDEVAKYMQQYVNAQGMSARSDQALASAITGNPSSHLSTIANKEVIKPLLAVERMKQMALADFKASSGHGNDYMTFLNEWQNTHDPRAFLVDLLDDKQVDKMLAGMNKNDRLRFDKTLKVVEANPGIMGQAVMPH